MLWEREASLGVLERCLADASDGGGRLVLVAGEAGVGKTSLVRELCRRHGTDARAWWGACDALATPSPLGPLYDIARQVGGQLGALMAGDGSQYERFGGFLAAVAAVAERPLVVVLEDVHWADQATLDLLVFLGRRLDGCRAVVVATYRDDELTPDHPLRTVLGRLTGPQVRRVRLESLSERAVAGMAAGHPVDPAAVYKATGGNPFFVTEVLAAPPGTVPQTVRDAVLARVAQLSPAARAALEVVAVGPDRVDLPMVSAVAGAAAAAAVRECEQHGVVRPVGRSVGFRHELARLAVADTIPAVRLPDLHGAVLAHLEREPAADPARLAYHAARAHDPAAVLRYAPEAAAHAARLGAHREAAAQYQEALRYADTLPPAEHADLRERYARECSATGRHADAAESLDRASVLWREIGDVDGQARAVARHAHVTYMTTSTKETFERLAEALALVEGRPASPALAAVYADAAFLYSLTQDRELALHAGTRAVALAEQFAEHHLLTSALVAVGTVQWWTDPDRAEALLVRAVEAAHRSGRAATVVTATGFLGGTALGARRYRTADRWLARVVEWCVEHDLDAPRDFYRACQATSHFEQGRWPQAAEIVAALTAPGAGTYRPAYLNARRLGAHLAVRRGEPDQARPLAEVWQWAAGTGDPIRQWAVAAVRAEAAWHAGQAGEIPDLVGETYRGVLELSHPWAIGELAYWMWRGGALDRPPEGAAEPYARLIRGEWEAAVQAWEALGCPYEAAEARADSDDPAQLREALETFYRLGARPAANRLVHRLRRLGVTGLPRRPHRSTGANPAGLTDRELEVAALLAEALSNADIAARLHISLRTAGHHVTAVLGKLQVANRREAADVARRLGIGSPAPR